MVKINVGMFHYILLIQLHFYVLEFQSIYLNYFVCFSPYFFSGHQTRVFGTIFISSVALTLRNRFVHVLLHINISHRHSVQEC